MKKLIFLLMACGIFAPCAMQAQNVTPVQVKEAREAVYQWLSDYQLSCTLKGRSARYRFVNLFENTSVEVFNDYLPDPNYHFDKPTVTVEEYVAIVQAKDTFDIRVAISNAKVQSEKLSGSNIRYQVSFTKSISFFERDNYESNSIVYPYVDFRCTVQLTYDLDERELKATSLTVSNPMKPFFVIHEEAGNRYVDAKESLDTARPSPIIAKSYVSLPFDAKVKVARLDTLMNAWGFSFVTGRSFFDVTFSNPGFDSVSAERSKSTRFAINYYRQMWLSEFNRIGIETGLSFGKRTLAWTAKFAESYITNDPDGSSYQRLIDVDNYKEKIDQTMLSLPIAVRYDRFLTNQWGVFGLMGIQLDYAHLKSASATANTFYRGYYEELFGVTLDQNGVYDFGHFDLDETRDQIAINPFSVSFVTALGGSFYYKDFELDLGCRYWAPVLKFIDTKEVFHLTEHQGDWTSSTYEMSRLSINNIGFLMQIKYNF